MWMAELKELLNEFYSTMSKIQICNNIKVWLLLKKHQPQRELKEKCLNLSVHGAQG